MNGLDVHKDSCEFGKADSYFIFCGALLDFTLQNVWHSLSLGRYAKGPMLDQVLVPLRRGAGGCPLEAKTSANGG